MQCEINLNCQLFEVCRSTPSHVSFGGRGGVYTVLLGLSVMRRDCSNCRLSKTFMVRWHFSLCARNAALMEVCRTSPGPFCHAGNTAYISENMSDPFTFWIKKSFGFDLCCGSMTFWGGPGSGTADPLLWLIDAILLFSSLTFKMPAKN